MIIDISKILKRGDKRAEFAQVNSFINKFVSYNKERSNLIFKYLLLPQYYPLSEFICELYLSETEQEYLPSKGVFLCGTPGGGKSTLVYAISGICNINYFTAAEIENSIIAKSFDYSILDYYSKRGIIIDDLGAEQFLKSYGNEPPIKNFICRLYDCWRFKHAPIIICSNFSLNKQSKHWIGNYYGQRVASRLTELTTPFQIGEGIDKREKE